VAKREQLQAEQAAADAARLISASRLQQSVHFLQVPVTFFFEGGRE
jgi:hypothetical protein